MPHEASPWLSQDACAMAQAVRQAGTEAQLALIRAHPELAGKAMVAQSLTAESTNEQAKAGLTHCTPEEFATLLQLNEDYKQRFGWPFILAVRGPRGLGLTRQEIIATFARRLNNPKAFELAECLRNIHRIVEIRLNDKFGTNWAPEDRLFFDTVAAKLAGREDVQQAAAVTNGLFQPAIPE